MWLTFEELGKILGIDCASLTGGISGFCTDSRKVKSGDLFVALRGQQRDGHDFVAQAIRQGATFALVEKSVPGVARERLGVVADARRSLGLLAAYWHQRCGNPTAAVTGSVGKTTVKEMLTSALGGREQVCATSGNYNNDLGVPLTLASEEPTDAYAVIEMGANAMGEIAYLASLVKPHVGVITAIEPAHVEGFGGLEGVARAKSELFAALPEDGVGVFPSRINHRDILQRALGKRKAISVATNAGEDGDLRVKHCEAGEKGWHIQTTGICSVDFCLPLIGRHSVTNALLALAAAWSLGVEPMMAAERLQEVKPIPGRMHVLQVSGERLLVDDTYNASPASVKAALDWLAQTGRSSLLVFGDMAELGEESLRLHHDIGVYARKKGIGALFAVGDLAAAAVDAFGSGGKHFGSQEELQEAVLASWPKRGAVLVKGSRSMAMERVVHFLKNHVSSVERD